ncbi:Methyltransferase domain-containing protein [Pedococcus cremeus]|uniref:Methyltransferase domain-containing protein n=1 Tax=Pedococcus cremeus TaxID=587636 RepID=A0A1H9TEA3_9MICO|nr:Methyltransferase domain-containing protein [Pedococcus cremeus]
MGTGHGRASPDWLALRERADAAARAPELVEQVRSHLPGRGLVVHDLGCGTGSMARWLAPQLAGPQHWVMVDRDAELLRVAATSALGPAADGSAVTAERRQRDITRLAPEELRRAGLITASALLDMLTDEELSRLVVSCAAARCPVLITLSVTGHVDLLPCDPFDEVVREAFNGHQRRRLIGGQRLLGPDAVDAAVDWFHRAGLEVLLRLSPWRLGPDEHQLQTQWFTGWLGAACERSPGLAAQASAYAERRLADAAAGRLRVTVHHQDLLVLPR